MRASLSYTQRPDPGAECSVLIPQGLFTLNLSTQEVWEGVKPSGGWSRSAPPEFVGSPTGDFDVASTPMIVQALQRVGLSPEQLLDAVHAHQSECLLLDGSPPKLLRVQPWLRKHKNAVVAEIPLDGSRVSGRRSTRLSRGVQSVCFSSVQSGELLRLDLASTPPAVDMRLPHAPPGDARRTVSWVPAAVTGQGHGMLVADVDPAGGTRVTLLGPNGVQATRTVRAPPGAALPFRTEKGGALFVVEERSGRPVLALWELPSLRELKTVALPEVPFDLDGNQHCQLLLAVDRGSATLFRTDHASTLEVATRWSFEEISGAGAAAPAAAPAGEPDIAFWSEHRLWGTTRELAWRSGRIESHSMRGSTTWQVEPERVEAAIQVLWKERFWELRSTVPPVPDETLRQLAVRGPEGTKTGALFANAWRRGPGAPCHRVLEVLFAEPPPRDGTSPGLWAPIRGAKA